MRLIKGAFFGGIILFVWSMISWMALPWHNNTLHKFSNEKAVASEIKNNAPISGIYLLPSMGQDGKPSITNVPNVFAAVGLGGMPSMSKGMVLAFVTDFVAAFLVTWMLAKTNLGYGGRVFFTIIFALTAAIITDVPYWTWFSFPSDYTLVTMADVVIGWFLASLVLAKVSGSK